MFCSSCGKTLDSDAKFCDNCGMPVVEAFENFAQKAPPAVMEERTVPVKFNGVLRCSHCGATLTAGSRFCGVCGTSAGQIPVKHNENGVIPLCKRCGANLLEGALFCDKCGEKI